MESYGVGFKYKELSLVEQKARLRLIDRVIEMKRQLTEQEGIEICENKKIYEILKRKNIFAFMDNKITFLYPVSAVPTNHKVKLADGREFFSMCAVDALGVSSMFHIDSEIFSVCSETGEHVYVKVCGGEIEEYFPKTLHVLHVDLTKENNWAAEC